MSKLINLTLIVLVFATFTNCKTKKSEKAKQEASQAKEVTPKKVKKKKAPKTDPLKIIAQAPEGMNAKAVVDNYFEVIGGADKAKKVKTLLIKSSAKDTPTRTFEFITKYKNPNKIYQQTAEEGEVFSKLAFNGKKGYGIYEGDRMDFSPEEVKEYTNHEKYIFPDFDYAKGELKGIAEVKGEKCYMIDYKHYKVYYSVATGLRVVVIEMGKDEEGELVVAVKAYTSNYTEVDGLKFPFKLRDVITGLRTAKMDIQEMVINKDVSDKDFE